MLRRVREVVILNLFTVLFVALAVALLFPVVLFAQTNDELRAQIRADLMTDPRTSEMTPTELDAMVEALATQAEEDGTAADYLEARSSFDYASLFPAPTEPSFLARTLASPLMLALAFLLVVLLSVALYIIRRRGRSSEIPSDIAA